jgi:hypothetical protein
MQRARLVRLLLAASLGGLLWTAPASADPVAITAIPTGLETGELPSHSVGRLIYRGGFVLRSPDKRFGGLSGLWVSEDGGRMVAVSDNADWLTANLTYDRRGWLAGIADGEMGRLKGLNGLALSHDHTQRDAESLTRLNDGGWLVSFERDHRLWVYDGGLPPFSGKPKALAVPPGLKDAPFNDGVEAVAALPDGRILAISEGLIVAPGQAAAWIGDGTVWQRLSFALHEDYQATGAKALPNGDVMVLERRFTPVTGPGARLRLIPASSIVPDAVLTGEALAEIRPPLNVDNMEGLAVRRGKDETLVYLLSDDNFQVIQKTLLMMFALPD